MAEPVTLAEVKGRLGVRSDHRDAEITDLIPAAREQIETESGCLLVRREVTRRFDAFPCGKPLELVAQPVISLTGITYFAADGTGAVVDDGRLIAGEVGVTPWQVWPAVSKAWPAAGSPAQIAVTVDAGFDRDAEDAALKVPYALKQAIFLLIAHWFENHEGVVVGTSAVELPLGVTDLCSEFRFPGIT